MCDSRGWYFYRLVFCVCALTSVEPTEVTLLGSLTVIEGDDLDLSCVTSSSNPPVQIRWWLGHKELNASAVAVEEVRESTADKWHKAEIHLTVLEDENNAGHAGQL